jgi:Fe-S oxidoreductase
MLKEDYKEILGDDWDIEVRHFTEYILDAIKSDKIKLPDYKNITATYHDPCHLGKQSKIYDQPREILKKTGMNLVEMQFNRQNSFCCGGGGGLQSNNPELADKVAKQRIEQAQDVNAQIIITPCTLCDMHMQRNGKDSGVKVYEFSQVLVGGLKL